MYGTNSLIWFGTHSSSESLDQISNLHFRISASRVNLEQFNEKSLFLTGLTALGPFTEQEVVKYRGLPQRLEYLLAGIDALYETSQYGYIYFLQTQIQNIYNILAAEGINETIKYL